LHDWFVEKGIRNGPPKDSDFILQLFEELGL